MVGEIFVFALFLLAWYAVRGSRDFKAIKKWFENVDKEEEKDGKH